MRYINLLIPAYCFLSACASSPPPVEPVAPNSKNTPVVTQPTAAELEIQNYAQALSALMANQHDKAETMLLDITKKHPDLAGPWANLGLLYIKKEQYDKAKECLTKSVERNGRLAQSYHLLGVVENKSGSIIKAKQYYEKALSLRDDYALAHYNLALIYDIYLHDLPNAILHYKRYLGLIKHEDKKTTDWVNELTNLMKKG